MTESTKRNSCSCFFNMSLDEPYHDVKICECECHE